MRSIDYKTSHFQFLTEISNKQFCGQQQHDEICTVAMYNSTSLLGVYIQTLMYAVSFIGMIHQ